MREFGELEAAVMDRLWSRDEPATVREVLEDLNRDRALAYTTVMTVMENLRRKGFLSREADGRAYRYRPVQGRTEHTADLVAQVLGRSEDRAAPLLRFVEQLTADELSRLRTALDAAGPGAPPGADPRGSRP